MSGTIPNLSDHIEMGVFEVFQIPYSALHASMRTSSRPRWATGAGTLIRGGAARGAPAEDKDWRQGPLGTLRGGGSTPLGVLGRGATAG